MTLCAPLVAYSIGSGPPTLAHAVIVSAVIAFSVWLIAVCALFALSDSAELRRERRIARARERQRSVRERSERTGLVSSFNKSEGEAA